ncbi:ELAV-like protein 1 [Varroa jacobsoni]|uniref:RRM domain-containing protein n=1 Tax=Varroa destructor TaxID=109461 RepID=A0A7M7JYA2_VARDE|nr:ELAV-like protein 1 [Varroa destructor]XP_022687641.1 ELAV-like protein 1 [Varroa jacobsoni]
MANCYGSHPGDEPSSSNLIINYLPQRLSDQEFHDLFAQIGPIKTCKIVRNKQSGYSYGFGFVDYHNPDDAQKAIGSYNGYKMDNKTLKVAIAKPSDSNHSKNTNVYIRGVPRNFDPAELEAMFSQFGRLVQFRVLRDMAANANKGVAFALYDDKSNADRAIQGMSGKTLQGGVEPLQVKIADDQMKLKKHRAMTMGEQMGGRVGGPMHGRMGGPPFHNSFRPNVRFNPIHKAGPGNYGGQGGGYGQAGGQNAGSYDTQNGSGGGFILFVYNIGVDTDDSSLFHLFAQYGTVEKASVIQDKMTMKSKGYGFVTMQNYSEAVWAIEQLNGFHYAGKPLQVSFKTPGKVASGSMGGAMGTGMTMNQGAGMGMAMDQGGYDNGNQAGGYGTAYGADGANGGAYGQQGYGNKRQQQQQQQQQQQYY